MVPASALCDEFSLVGDWPGEIDHRKCHRWSELALRSMLIDSEMLELGRFDDRLLGDALSEIEIVEVRNYI